MIAAAGPQVTLLHAGRSSQDMHATYRAAILRDDMLNLADQLNQTAGSLVKLAQKHVNTIAAGRLDQGQARQDFIVTRQA